MPTPHDNPENAPEVVEQRFEVSFDYPVVFTRDALRPDNLALVSAIRRREPQKRHRVLVVLDEGVASAHPALTSRIAEYVHAHASSLELLGAPTTVIGGEAIKQSAQVVTDLQARMHALKVDRHSFLLCIGGGAVLDAVGYAAATTHRGVRLVRMPSTVLAQNDAGIGVKNGINAFGAKNFLGTFVPPFAVINDSQLLETLSERDRRAGMAEAVKAGLIRDGAFFAWLAAHADELVRFEAPAVQYMVSRAADIHLRHIREGGDPFELGSARPLDFGHWAAHKLESLTHSALRHGEAVAIGMAIDTRYSVEAGLLSAADGDAVLQLLRTLGFRLWDDALDTRAKDGSLAVLAGLEDFREHLGGELTITLLTALGRTRDVHTMETDKLQRVLAQLKAEAERCA